MSTLERIAGAGLSAARSARVAAESDVEWISAKEFRELAEMTRQAASNILSACYQGQPWRGYYLAVRTANGKPPSQRNPYQVRADSLPLELFQRYMRMHPERFASPEIPKAMLDCQLPVITDAALARHKKAVELAKWQEQLIAPALATRKHSSDRTFAVAAVVKAGPHTRPDGTTVTPNADTVERWIRKYEKHGLAGLMRQPRHETKPRRIVSVSFDKLCPLPDDTKREIWGEVEHDIKSRIVNSHAPLEQIRLLVNARLVELAHEHGWDEASLQNCDVGIGQIRKYKDLRVAAWRSLDNQRYRDRCVPRIGRTGSGYQAMEVVFGDVHPVDILKAREDGIEVDGEFMPNGSYVMFDMRADKGETATARMITWYDVGTKRFHATHVLCGPRQDVTQAHVVASFVAMAMDWGLPRRLYLDNGKEYLWRPFILGFERLAAMVRGIEGLEVATVAGADMEKCLRDAYGGEEGMADDPAVTRSMPHNPQGKAALEGLFGVLERTVFSMVPGWIGGDRLNKKTHRVGQAPRAFDGSWSKYIQAMATCRDYHHHRKDKDGLSPNDRLAATIEHGWRATQVKYEVLLVAFAEPMSLMVTNQGIEIRQRAINSAYWADEMAQPGVIGSRVKVFFCKWDTEQIFFECDGRLVMARKARDFAMLDRAGAVEQARRARLVNAQLSAIKRALKVPDLVADMKRVVDLSKPAPVIPFGPAITLDALGHRLAPPSETDTDARKPELVTLGPDKWIDKNGDIRSDYEDIEEPEPWGDTDDRRSDLSDYTDISEQFAGDGEKQTPARSGHLGGGHV